MDNNKETRLQKYLAHCGFGSRRECEKMIADGRVVLNGHVVRDMGVKIDPQKDSIYCDGQKAVSAKRTPIVIMLNKPKECVSTRQDPQGRKTIYNFLPHQYKNIFHIGRLDYHSEGLILFTNDGDFAQQLTKPESSIAKVYEVKVKSKPVPEVIDKLRKGIRIEGKKTRPAIITFIRTSNKNTWYRIQIHEGKNRQIRKMFEMIHHPVLKLKRIGIGNIFLRKLPVGQWRFLNLEEIKILQNMIENT
jgi:23S rRNA pseudouridine2605 synthase